MFQIRRRTLLVVYLSPSSLAPSADPSTRGQALLAFAQIAPDSTVLLTDISDLRIYVRNPGSMIDLTGKETKSASERHIEPEDLIGDHLVGLPLDSLLIQTPPGSSMEGSNAPLRILGGQVADLTSAVLFNENGEEFEAGLQRILSLTLSTRVRWFDHEHENDRVVQALRMVAPNAVTVLAMPLWHRRGAPGHMALFAFDKIPRGRDQIAGFTKIIMNALMDAITLGRARKLEQAQAMFNMVQSQ